MSPAPVEPLVEQVADQIRIWSGQKQVLADRLADLRSAPVADIVDLHEDPAPLARSNLVPKAPPVTSGSLVEDLVDPSTADPWMPVVRVGSDEPLRVDDVDSPAGNETVPVTPDQQFGPFDELFEVVSQTHRESVRTGPLPPRTRFMVRVARVPKPSRTTKRNYNYFEELNSALAQRSATPQAEVGANGQRTTEDWLPLQDPI